MSRSKLMTALAVLVVVAVSCSSGHDFTVGNALTLRREVNLQTGRQHLSIADYVEIGTELCDGAVNDRARLVELSAIHGLGAYADDNTGAAALWRGAYQTCPDEIDGDGTEAPFDRAVVLPPDIVEVDGFPSAFPEFADVGLLDSQIVEWREGVELGLYSTTTLEATEALETLQAGLPEGWTSGELFGPVTDIAGFDTFSIDISGFGWQGTMDALTGPSGVFGEPDRTTFVIIVLVPA